MSIRLRVTKPSMARKGVAPDGACAAVAPLHDPVSPGGKLSDFCAYAPSALPASDWPLLPPVAELPPPLVVPPAAAPPDVAPATGVPPLPTSLRSSSRHPIRETPRSRSMSWSR